MGTNLVLLLLTSALSSSRAEDCGGRTCLANDMHQETGHALLQVGYAKMRTNLHTDAAGNIEQDSYGGQDGSSGNSGSDHSSTAASSGGIGSTAQLTKDGYQRTSATIGMKISAAAVKEVEAKADAKVRVVETKAAAAMKKVEAKADERVRAAEAKAAETTHDAGSSVHLSQSMGTQRSWFKAKRSLDMNSINSSPDDEREEALAHIASLPDCTEPQSKRSLWAMAKHYRPSKFSDQYRHAMYQTEYPLILERYRTKVFRMVEIGLDSGKGSLLWQEYFPCAELYGIEYSSSAVQTEGAQAIHTFQGDQADISFLMKFVNQTEGGFSLIVDDGGHQPYQQLNSYKILFQNALLPGGTYIIEDIETSYWKAGVDLYGHPVPYGGYLEQRSVINQFREVVHVVNRKFYDNNYTVIAEADSLIKSLTFVMNLVILHKKAQVDCVTETFYVWPDRLADDCPARSQSGEYPTLMQC
mmetsp:Transcript_92958/g.170503  ORF Transcript_92958/g.170503 Transcript_92958/m.170503 type:complete len:471 (+) Transcript_92958:80-1492(+)